MLRLLFPPSARLASGVAAVPLLLCAFVLCGCGDAPSAPTNASEHAGDTRAAALGVLDSVRRGAMREASARLQERPYTRRVRTEQLGEAGRVIAFEERTLRYAPPGGARVVRSDSSGAFDFGTLGRFASADGEGAPPAADLTRQVLSEEPAFLSQRNRHAFRYRLLSDTTLPGGPARVVAVRARPGPDGDKQALRRARLYVDAATHQLVGMRLHRVRRSMLFDEDTRQRVFLRPDPDPPADTLAWVPAQTHFDTQLDLPLRPARRFRSAAAYSYGQ